MSASYYDPDKKAWYTFDSYESDWGKKFNPEKVKSARVTLSGMLSSMKDNAKKHAETLPYADADSLKIKFFVIRRRFKNERASYVITEGK